MDLLRYWVRKEAVLKALGVGLTVPMTSLTVSPPDQPPRVVDGSRVSPVPIALTDVELPGHLCSVAAVGTPTVRVSISDATSLMPSGRRITAPADARPTRSRLTQV